ncbi:DNA-binding transcriptional regulator, XRE-family HTH domain [Duganella sp. CF517]|uniref:helix-turn-helix transcriptional regulator n=1 Tax=Duganella sp. CF517 TaxID=1881038 RepID=UPI0008D22139|nr:helix-turn-helix transcriptional regulator [Duganella sp. CF517]SEN31710.1 DNA-binding transcriptional regulator, XRE-family HTH domain [Duganella sp. CF517]
MDNVFGTLVQQYREKAGLTQDDLSKLLDVSQQTIAKWESGRAYPRPAAFAKLSSVLRIPHQEIIEPYGQSKGARAPDLARNLYENTQNELRRAEGARGRDISNDIGFPQFDVNPYAPQTLRKDMLATLEPLLNAERPGAKWSENVRRGTLNWRIDYSDNEVVAEFKYAESPAALKKMLGDEVRLALWNLTTLRASLRDDRQYLLIIMMPANVRVDYEEGDPEWDDLEILTNEQAVRRLSAEAAPLDLSIFVANSPRQVLALIKLHGNQATDLG